MTTKVLQLLLTPAIGGAETLANGLHVGLAEHGFEVTTAFLDPAGSSSSAFARTSRLRRLIRSEAPDLILAHSAFPNLYARMVAGRRLPVVVVLHSASRDFDHRSLRSAERLLQTRTAAVVAVAKAQAEEYEASFGRSLPLELIPNGVPAGLGVRRERGDGVIRVVTLARINLQKDPETWRGAALIAVGARPDLTFAWSGPESSDNALQSLVAQSGHPAVVWAGPTHDAGAVLAEADIYFHPARAEAHPLAPLEAAAVGIPVVCSQAVAATLPVGLPAATFVTCDEQAAAEAVLAVAADLAGATRRAESWREHVRFEFGLDRVTENYARVLTEALSPAGAPSFAHRST